MLTVITEILRARALIEQDEEPGYNITLINEHLMNIAAHARSGASFHLKLKECGYSSHEYDNYCNAWRLFSRHVPEVIGREFRNDWEIILLRGVPHRRIPPGSIAANKKGVVQGILELFEASSSVARVSPPEMPHAVFLSDVQGRVTSPVSASIVSYWMVPGRLDGLPCIWQHGDFVINNLGLTPSGLVVFDWEDYGRIGIPGFDLCTLLASDSRFDANRLRAMIDGDKHAYGRLLERICPIIGLTPERFRHLIPLYLVLFLDLKRDYGEAIRKVVSTLVHGIQGTDNDGWRTGG